MPNREYSRKIHDQLTFTRQLNKLLINEDQLDVLLNKVCDLFKCLHDFSFTYLVLFNKDYDLESFTYAGELKDPQVLEDLYKAKKFPTSVKDALQSKKLNIITTKIRNCPLDFDFSRSTYLIKPLYHSNHIYGILGAQVSNESVWSENNFELFDELGNDISFSIAKIKQGEDLQQLVKDSHDGFAILDSKLNILEVNPAFCEIMEMSREELSGINGIVLAKRIFKGKSLKILLKTASEILSGKKGASFEIEYKNKILSVSTNFKNLTRLRLAVIRDITESRMAEIVIRDNELKFRNLVDSLMDSVMIIQDGIIRLVNKRLCIVSGFTKEELIGKEFTLFIAPEEVNKALDYYRARNSGKTVPAQYESLAITKSGEKIPVETTVTEIEFEDRPAWQVVLHDISEQKEWMTNIEAANKQLQKAQQLGNMGSWVFDMTRKKVIATEHALNIYGYDYSPEIDLAYIQEAPLPEYRKMLDEALLKLIRGEDKYNVEFKIRNRKTGKILDIHSIAEYDPNSNLVSGIIQDISAKKKTEQELVEVATNFSNIFNVTDDTICILDVSGKIIEVNQTFIDRMEYSKEELLGRTVSIIDKSATDRMIITANLDSPKQEIFKMESVHTTKSGRSFPVEIYAKWIEFKGQESILAISRDITERQQSYQILEESEEKFRTIFVNKGTATAILDEKGYVLLANEQCSVLSGYSKEELEGGMSWMSLVHPDDFKKLAEQQHLRFTNPKAASQSYEARLLNKDDEIRNVLINIEVTTNHQRVVSLVDITERIKAEEKLREQKNFLWLLIDNMPIQIFWKDTDLVYKGCNSIFAEVVGLESPKKVKGKTDRDFNRRDDYNRNYLRWDRKVMESKLAMYNHEEAYFTSDGMEGTALTSRIPLMNGKNEVEGILGFSLDITEIKNAEAELISSQLKFKSYVENSPYGVFVVDEKGNYLDVNEAATLLTGYTKEELVQLNIVNLLIPEEVDFALNEFRKLVKDTTPINIELHYKRKNGEIRRWDVNATKIGDNRFLGFSSDITDRKENEEELLKAKIRAEESDRLKSAFLATVSHELRTPLNHILGFSDLIPDLTNDQQIVEFANLINKSGTNLLEIIENIFNLAMIEQKQIKLRKNEVYVRDIFLELKKELQNALSESNKSDMIELDFSIEKEIANKKIITDKPKVIQAVSNILKNAVKYTHKGFIRLKVEIETGGQLCISVVDSGIGIPKDKLDIIFDFFRQVDDSHTRKYGGVGIGLALAKKIADALAGEIQVHTEINSGSTFILKVPVSDIKIHTVSSIIKKKKDIVPDLMSKQILVVEDDSVSMELISLLLTPLNCKLLKATNGQEAIETVLQQKEIDLIFMDLKMPVMDGFAATSKIRKILPHIPIIALTAHALNSEKERALNAGCNDLITKPIKTDVLFEKLRSTLLILSS